MPRNPATGFLQWLLAQPKSVYTPFNRALEESCPFQHLEVV